MVALMIAMIVILLIGLALLFNIDENLAITTRNLVNIESVLNQIYNEVCQISILKERESAQ